MEIRPFKAYRFNPERVGNVADCLAPPYDVIDSQSQQQLYQKSAYNIVRIIKPAVDLQNGPAEPPYTKAARTLENWMKNGILKQDTEPTIYAYIQDFELAGAWFRRLSFIAQAKLEEFGRSVRPHEQTMLGPRQDRLELLKATRARLGLVFLIYEDPAHVAENVVEQNVNNNPLIDYTDDNNVRHQLFSISKSSDIKLIKEMMADKICIIADGHHRYETGLIYAKTSGDPQAWYQMMAFTNMLHDGLVVLATHRVINGLEGFDFKNLIEQLKKNFEIERYPFDSADSAKTARHKMLDRMKTEHARDRNAFGIYGADDAFYVAVLKNSAEMERVAPDKTPAWRALDVAVLSKLVLEPILGIDEQKLAKGEHLEYVKDSGNTAKELVKLVDTGRKQVVFFMNPPKIKQIQAVAMAGERMPQKSTYFYPKVYSGLVIDKL